MSRYQTGHILGAFPLRFYQTESRDEQVTRVRRSHRLCAEGEEALLGEIEARESE